MSIFLTVGHIGEQDAIINIEVGIEQGRLKPGDTMAIIAAGIGYVWAGAIVQWGLTEMKQTSHFVTDWLDKRAKLTPDRSR